eukprot:1997098-Pleurochrysis_carterae.AAC.1
MAHNLLLRAGEIGHPQEREFDGTRDLTWASIQWMKPTSVSGGHEWALVLITAIKDAQARGKPTPMPVRRRQRGGQRGDDA